MIGKTNRSERNWVLVWAVAIVLLSSLPYLWGAWITPPGYHFLGLTHNIDDGAVYLSWMRQAADGHFFIRNLFTNEPQVALAFNVLFLVMGWFAALTRLSLVLVYHIFRAGLGVGLILMVWQFSKLFLDDPRARRILVPLVGLSAGVGWLFPGAKMPIGPVDTWQPEAITFLSIYLNPLFLAGMILMLASFYFLVLARRTGCVRWALYAGLSMLALGNIHTYDIVTVACVWAAYLVVLAVAERRLPAREIGLSALAGLVSAPSLAYQFYLYAVDPVFRARANSPTPSPALWSFFAGYGLVLVGAIIGVVLWQCLRAGNSQSLALNPRLLLVWSVVGFILPYLPVGQQRKLVMGLHIPLCILCAYAVVAVLDRLPRRFAGPVLAATLLLLATSNVRFLANDIALLSSGRTVTHYAPYISTSELSAMRYLREHVPAGDAAFAPPGFALFTPAFAGRQVYYGHWSETPCYEEKIMRWGALADPNLSIGAWLSIVCGSGSRWYVSTAPDFKPPRQLALTRLSEVFSRGPVAVYYVADRN